MSREKLNVDFEYYQPRKVMAWFWIGGWVWLPLLLGWVLFFYSVLTNFEIPASGAVLVCVALISEILLRHTYWATLQSFNPNTQFRLSYNNQKIQFFFTNGYKIKATKQTLSLFSISDELQELWHGKENCWRAYKTATRASKTVSIPIVVTAVFGTLVWGYAHLLVASCNIT